MKVLKFICGALVILSFLLVVILGFYLSAMGLRALFILGGIFTWLAIGIISFVILTISSILWKIFFED